MQIVRDLGGYTLGRSDLVRRAMSKKKQSVMEKERANFIYGNEEEGVPGCIAGGISEQVAGQIYEDMMDFAKYAFNKSHAACYAVVAYQTAWLKHYYPVEFMAALLTSVIDNPGKVSEYILTCRNMGIELLPPDINQGQSGFSVSDGSIRYALTAIKGVGRSAIGGIVQERRARGAFLNLKDFISRTLNTDINKRAVESFIKAGALDSLGGTRKQFMSVYVQMMDSAAKDKKSNMAGQMSLFDIVGEESKAEFDVRLPDVGEYPREMLLAFEKEVLGIYISGHPLEEDKELWQRHITNHTGDFILNEESGTVAVQENGNVIVGGIITDKTIKYTKNDNIMAFLNLEDLVGNMEIIVFPKDYERYGSMLMEDAKVFIKGRVSAEEDKDAKLILGQLVTFEEAAPKQKGELFANTDQGSGNPRKSYIREAPPQNREPQSQTISKMPRGVWVQFADAKSYEEQEQKLLALIADSDGNDDVVIFLKKTKAIKVLPANRRVCADETLRTRLEEAFGVENIKFLLK